MFNMQAQHLTPNPSTNPSFQAQSYNTRFSPSLRAAHYTASGKHILITNASHSPGPSIAISFARAGVAAIALSSPDASDLAPVIDSLRAINPTCKILTIACDTTRSSSVARLFSATKDTFGTLDIVIANVGTAHLDVKGEDRDRDENDEWWDDMTTNFRSTHLPAHQYIRSFGAEGMGTFISITSGRKRVSGPEVAWDLVKEMDRRLVEFLDGEYPGLNAFSIGIGFLNKDRTDSVVEMCTGDDEELVGRFCIWLGSRRVDRLSGCCVDATWDLEELERQGVDFPGKAYWN